MHHLGPALKGGLRATGPTVFQNIGYVVELMEKAGLSEISGSPVEIDLVIFRLPLRWGFPPANRSP